MAHRLLAGSGVGGLDDMQYRVQVLAGLIVLALLASVLEAQDAVQVPRAVQPGPSAAEATQELHRALGLLQYVYGDYAAAVDDHGVILNEEEFLEQHQILDEVAAILESAGRANLPTQRSSVTSLGRGFESARDAVALLQPPAVVRAAVRQLRDTIVAAYALRLSPERPPRLERGAALYQQACSACHGGDGRARTALAMTLRPPPTDFHAPRLSETLSPYHVFNVVTFGVPGTAMPSFATLDVDERWDLAFHVMSIRHEPAPDKWTGPPRVASAAAELPSLSELAGFSDAELGDWFMSRGLSVDDKDSAVARARHLSMD